MTRDNLLSRISVDPKICFGKPCIRGHRIWVSLILDLLVAEETIETILEECPGLEKEDILACIAYGAEMARDYFVEIPTEAYKEAKKVNIKLDENLGNLRVITWLRLAGYDVTTVREQGLTSAPDEELIDVCRGEGRILVTLDRGFGNRLKYNPSNYPGIVVIRLFTRSKFNDRREAIETLITGLEAADITGKLWIISNGNIQEYQPIELED